MDALRTTNGSSQTDGDGWCPSKWKGTRLFGHARSPNRRPPLGKSDFSSGRRRSFLCSSLDEFCFKINKWAEPYNTRCVGESEGEDLSLGWPECEENNLDWEKEMRSLPGVNTIVGECALAFSSSSGGSCKSYELWWTVKGNLIVWAIHLKVFTFGVRVLIRMIWTPQRFGAYWTSHIFVNET